MPKKQPRARKTFTYVHQRPLGHDLDRPPGPPATPRDAATLILARERRGHTEVLMGRRSRKARFVPDVFVFPGGRLDGADWKVAPASGLSVPLYQLAVRNNPRKATALANAAVRETFEETGLLLASDGDPGTASDDDGTWPLLQKKRKAPDHACLSYVGRAITSPYSPIRFHARFFLADGDQATGKLGGSGELSDLHWTRIDRALADLPIIDVTEFMLKEVAEIRANPKALKHRPLFAYRELVPYVRYD